MYGKIDGQIMREKLRECVKLKGPEILRSNNPYFKGVILDLLPGYNYEQERNLLIFVVNILRLGDEFLKVPSGKDVQQNFYNYQLQRMMESGVFADDTVGVILQSFAYSLDWQVRQPKQSEQPKKELNIERFSRQVTQPHVKFEATQSVSLSSLRAVYKDKQVGDRFEFGRYPQGSNCEEKAITWRVLRRDSDSLLVIAEMGLDCKSYNERDCSITWSDCTLRRWLNDEFYKRAFNQQEQSLIKKTSLTNNAGPSTEDNVFLLSVDEARSLFASDNDRICKPTGYAVKNGVYINGNGMAWWWLRSRGSINCNAALVGYFGGIGDGGYYVLDFHGVIRPAFQLAV